MTNKGADIDNFGNIIDSDVSLQSINSFGDVVPFGFNGDLIVNGNFLLTPQLVGWDTPNAYYSGIPNVGAILTPGTSYSIKQDVTGDPTRYYKVSFRAAAELPLSVSDAFIRIEIVDTITNTVLLDKTEFVNNLIGIKYYNIVGISQAEVRFYAIGHSISLLKVSITDGPLMYTNRVNSTTIYNFVHTNHDWKTVSSTPFEHSEIHQDITAADGLYLSPNGNDVKISSVLSLNTTSKTLEVHQPFIDGVIDSILNYTGDIKDIDFGYENGLLTFYTCSDLTSINLKKFGVNGVVSSIPVSSPFQIRALKKELNGGKLWVASAVTPHIYEINLSSPFSPLTPSSFGYALDIDVKAMAHDAVSNVLYSVGQDRTFLPTIKSSVYKTDLNDFGITSKIFTVDGSYNSIECISSVPGIVPGTFQPLSGRIIIGGDRSVPFGSGPDDQILISIDPNGTVDWAYDIPEIQNIGDISAIQINDGRRPGIECLITDPTTKSVYTINVRSGYGFRHYYDRDAIASFQVFLRKVSQAIEKDIPVNSSKWYVIDTDIVDNEWSESGPLGEWFRPLTVYTTDGRIKNADIGSNGPSVFNPALNTDFYKKSTNLYSRILYRPSGNIMRLGFDAGSEPSSLEARASDGAKFAKLSGVSVSEIDLNNITLSSSNQIKEIFTFDNSTQGWSLNNDAVYDSTVQSIHLTAATIVGQSGGYIEKEFNVRKFKKFKIGININRNNSNSEFTGSVEVSINGVELFTNQVGEYLQIVEKTGYFESEFVPQVDKIVVRVSSNSYSSSINYLCVVYTDVSDIVDPCAFQDVKAKLNFNGVPFMPYLIFDTAIKYTLRDYDDPSIRGTVTVPHRDKSYYSFNFGNSILMCYSWIVNPIPVNILSYNQTIASTANPGAIINSSSFKSVLCTYRNGFAVNLQAPVLPAFDFSYPLHYENIPQRIVSGNPICTQHEDSPFYKPCVVESIEYMLLISTAPNLQQPLTNLFGSGCGYSNLLNINIGYLKDDDVLRTEFNTTFDLIYALQTVGVPDPSSPYISLPQARWESFKVVLDLPSGTGVDQCTEPIEGFLVTGTAEFNAGSLIMNQTGGGGGGGDGGVCVVNVFVQVINTGASGSAVQRVELSLPDGGTWRIVYGDLTASDVTSSLLWNASADQIQLALSGVLSLNSSLVTVTGSFPVYVITFDASLGVVPELTILNNLTCTLPDLGFIDPGPYSYELPKPGPNTGGGIVDDSCDSCLPSVTETIKIHRESLSVGCFDGNCSSPIRTMACRFVNNANRFQFYKFVNNKLIGLGDDYDPLPGDQIVLLDKSIGLNNAPIDKIKRSFSYV